MIISNKEYFYRRQLFKQLKTTIKSEIFKLAIFTLVCVIVAALLTKSNDQTSYTFYYAQKKVVNKNTRGVFPPLDGQYWNLYGQWQIAAKIGQAGTQIQKFENYIIIFEQANRMYIRKKQSPCTPNQNLLIYQWKTYSYNLFISPIRAQYIAQQLDPQNVTSSSEQQNKPSTPASPSQTANNLKSTQTPTNNKDNPILQSSPQPLNSTQLIKCFDENDDAFLNYIHSCTVWTIREQNLYLISQAISNGVLDISIFVLTSA